MNVNYCYKTGVKNSNPMDITGISGVLQNGTELIRRSAGSQYQPHDSLAKKPKLNAFTKK